MDKKKIIYQLSVEDIFNIIENSNLNLQLSETDITFIEKKVSNYIDWRGALESVLWELQNSKEK